MTIRLAVDYDCDEYVCAIKLSADTYTLSELANDLELSEYEMMQVLSTMSERGLVSYRDEVWQLTDAGRAAV
jgi:Mn-dependent DtxR family transcriptional regulator